MIFDGKAAAKKIEITPKQVEEALERLESERDIFEPRGGFVQRFC